MRDSITLTFHRLHVMNPGTMDHFECGTSISPPMKIGRLKTGVFDVKAHLTIQILEALKNFQNVEKYTLGTKMLNVEFDMYSRFICHSDLHVENILVSTGEGIYNSFRGVSVFKDIVPHEEINEIKVTVIDFGTGIIVKNRFETYKDYFDVENALRKLWYGDSMFFKENCWNNETKEYECLLTDVDLATTNLKQMIGDEEKVEKVKILQTLLSNFIKIKNGMQRLYENNCQSPEFREFRKRRKHNKEPGPMGYNEQMGPRVLMNGDQISKRVVESKLDGYSLKGVDNSEQYSFLQVSDVLEIYQADMLALKKKVNGEVTIDTTQNSCHPCWREITNSAMKCWSWICSNCSLLVKSDACCWLFTMLCLTMMLRL